MPVQMMELEEVQIMEASDDALEGAYFEPGHKYPKNPMFSTLAPFGNPCESCVGG